MTQVLNAEKVTKRFGGLVAVNNVDFTIPKRSDRQPHRPERRRQDDVLQHHRRHLRPVRRHDRIPRRDDDRPARRAWLEPILWLIPARRSRASSPCSCPMPGPPRRIVIGIFVTVILLLVVPGDRRRATAWLPAVPDALRHLRSARPNDMVVAGTRPDLPEHPPLPEHDGAGERPGRHARRAAGRPGSTRCCRPRGTARGGTPRSGRASCWRSSASRARATSSAKNLPYGDQRRLEIARALGATRSCSCSTSRPPA